MDLIVILGFIIIWTVTTVLLHFYHERKRRLYGEDIRKLTLSRSRAVLKGKIAEQMSPLLPWFEYHPADARFIGNPIDYIVFDGYTMAKEHGKGEIKVVLMDVKKGSSAKLTKGEKLIKEAVKKGRVEWQTLNI